MVKYADGPTTSVEIVIEAPPSAVWPVLCDINAPAAFSDEFQGADWLDDGPRLGARFEGRNRHARAGEWAAVSTITAFDVERCLEWTVGDVDFPAARWRYDLEAAPGGSRLRYTATIGPAPSGLTSVIESMPDLEEKIVEGRMAEHNENMRRTLEGLKGIAEA